MPEVNIPLLRKAVEWAEAEALCIAGKVAFDLTGNMSYFDAEPIAREALGLDNGQAIRLFNQWNDIEDVRRIAEDIAGERL